MSETNRPPLHAFELRITVGAQDWESAIRELEDAVQYVNERQPDDIGLSSGGYCGCHSVDLQRRDVTPERYRQELEQWRLREIAAKAGSGTE